MENSVLITIRKMVGVNEDCDAFDAELIPHINTALFSLCQLGVGPKDPAFISSEDDTWYTALGDTSGFEAVKTYVYLKVRTIFDPPASSVLEAMNRQIGELEWRLNVQAELSKEV